MVRWGGTRLLLVLAVRFGFARCFASALFLIYIFVRSERKVHVLCSCFVFVFVSHFYRVSLLCYLFTPPSHTSGPILSYGLPKDNFTKVVHIVPSYVQNVVFMCVTLRNSCGQYIVYHSLNN